jgi:hypothetical protein
MYVYRLRDDLRFISSLKLVGSACIRERGAERERERGRDKERKRGRVCVRERERMSE